MHTHRKGEAGWGTDRQTGEQMGMRTKKRSDRTTDVKVLTIKLDNR